MNNIHIRLTNKISILYDIITCTLYVLVDEDIKPIFKDESTNVVTIEHEYNVFIMPYVMAYFGKDNNETKLFTKDYLKKLDNDFISNVKSLNVQNKLDAIFHRCYPYLLHIVENSLFDANKKIVIKSGQFSNYIDAMRRLVQTFNQDKISLAAPSYDYTICEFCKTNMIVYSTDSILKCSKCGNIVKLNGVIFDYSTTNLFVKQKQDTSKKHAIRWLNYIQAIDEVPDAVIKRVALKAVEHFTINGELRDMSSLSCGKVRQWLKVLKLTKYNNSAPSIRKKITAQYGQSQIPPQLSSDECDVILNDIMKVLVAFKIIINDHDLLQRLGRHKIKKKTYYPYTFTKIFCYRLKYSPKLPGLIQCIHFQSATTLKQDDIIWQKICDIINFTYEPTDLATLQHMI